MSVAAPPLRTVSVAKHHNNFGIVRLYLAGAVFLGHYAWVFPDGIVPSHLARWLIGEDGLNGVRAFFVISGFFLFRSYQSSGTLRSYLTKRARRVLPAYIAVILICSAFGYFLSDFGARDYFSLDLLKYMFWNFLFLNFIHPTLPGVFQHQPLSLVNSSLWTLKIEIGFYLSVPIIMAATRWVRLPALLVGFYIGSVVYAQIFSDLFQTTGRPIFHTLALQMPGQICYFLSGALIEHYKAPLYRHAALTVGAAMAAILLSWLLAVDALFPIAYGAVIIMICTRLPYLGNWERYGDLSYGLYIFHFPILQSFRSLGLLADWPIAHFFAVTLTVFAMAYASWILVESRFLQSRAPRTEPEVRVSSGGGVDEVLKIPKPPIVELKSLDRDGEASVGASPAKIG